MPYAFRLYPYNYPPVDPVAPPPPLLLRAREALALGAERGVSRDVVETLISLRAEWARAPAQPSVVYR